jgi:3-hydroxymyristoyl/3-hydroxydecanoyl-(acyl carrier protein) dehydratase
MRTPLSPTDILEKLPHRHENIIVDEVTCVQDGDVSKAELYVTLSSDNPARALFLRTLPSGEQVAITPIFMEILALASVSCTPKTADQLLIYAGIAMFKKVHDLKAGDKAFGVVTRKRGRGVFINCEAQLYTPDNQLVCTSDLTAALVDAAAIAAADPDAPKRLMAIPEQSCNIAIDKQRYGKDLRMVVADTITHLAEDMIVTSYRYPEDHPCVRGHFPGNPIMMGVMQWMAIEDALQAYVWQYCSGADRPQTITAEGVLVRSDGAIVAEIKGYKAGLSGVSTAVYAELLETKKVIFREPLRPGETVFAILTSIETL